MEIRQLAQYQQQTQSAAPLAVIRILFGLLMIISLLRFWYHGWIEKLYILPQFHFHYFGFSQVSISPNYIYGLFILCGISALGVALGFKYRSAITLFFLSFTYIELLDKTTYLNHYYFVSVFAFLLIWLPANCYYAYDASKDNRVVAQYIPQWNVDILKLFLAIVYIYAGAAKLNYDWMVNAMPLSIWLPSKFDIPFLGSIMDERWVHYLFSWGGALYDLSIVFLLLYRKTRIFGFFLVVVFHLLTRVLFPIGMFPYIMIVSTLLFFGPQFHQRILAIISKITTIKKDHFDNGNTTQMSTFAAISKWVLTITIVLQLIIPLRSHLFTDNVYWTEIGYRFSWRVMLMEKTGYANFKIVNEETGKRFYVQNDDFLTAFQQKQMSTQPDFIIEYAHYLGNHFEAQGHGDVAVYVESYASLNGRPSQVYIDPNVNLRELDNNPFYRPYILPLND